jgi:hypothetical protein
METFTIYPKEGGRFKLEFTRFEFDKDRNQIVLYDNVRRELGFLVQAHIAGVAPSNPQEIERETIRVYTVWLRNHEEAPIVFEAMGYPAGTPIPHELMVDNRPLTNVYIDSTEVISLTSRLKRE